MHHEERDHHRRVAASGVYEKGEILKTKFPSAAYKLGLKVK